MPKQPKLIRRQDIASEYGFSERQAKRWIVEKRISHVHPGGPTSTCFLKTAELDSLIEESTTPAVKRTKGRASS